MKSKLFILGLLALVLSGCGCKNSSIKIITPMNPKTDPFLSCGQLKFAIAEAEYFLRSADRKSDNLEAYAGNPICLFETQFSIIKAQEAARDRLDYLRTVSREKNCTATKNTVEKPTDKDLVKLPTKQ
jgi:hypothetical protein